MNSNELKEPDDELYTASGTIQQTGVNNFWAAAGCAVRFTIAATGVPSGNALKHQGGGGVWGIEVTSVRYDRFFDNTVPGNVCFAPPGCMRESAPSACHVVSTAEAANQGINVNITQNSPGAQYYNVDINPQGCAGTYVGGIRTDFSFVNQFAAPVAGSPPTARLTTGRAAAPRPRP